MKMRIASLTILCLALLAIPASAQWTYENGPVNGNVSAWEINFGFVASDSFQTNGGPNSFVTGASIDVWIFPGDQVQSTAWDITSQPNGGTILGSGTANVTQTFLFTNSFGFSVDQLDFNITNVGPLNGTTTYWLNIGNTVEAHGDPVYWDENSGVGCSSVGCPSQASENQGIGTIPSEAFTLTGNSGSTPEPSTVMLFGSGILGLAGLLRRKLF